jgi:hypothetical protein
MDYSEIIKEAGAEMEGLKNGNVQVQVLKRKGLIKDYKITKTEIIKDYAKNYTDNVFTWETENYFICMNEFLKDEEKWTEIEIFKHGSDDCLHTFDVHYEAYDVSKCIENFSDKNVEIMAKEKKLTIGGTNE